MKGEVITEALEGEEEIYAFLVHGIVPEFMPHIAFRREKHFKANPSDERCC